MSAATQAEDTPLLRRYAQTDHDGSITYGCLLLRRVVNKDVSVPNAASNGPRLGTTSEWDPNQRLLERNYDDNDSVRRDYILLYVL